MDGMLVHRRVTPSSKFARTHLYTWVERGTMRVKYLAQEHNAVPRPGLEPCPPDPESSALTIRPPHLPLQSQMLNSNFPENPLGNCGLPPEVVLVSPFGTTREKFPYHLHGFPVPVSRQRKTTTGNRVTNCKHHLVRLVCEFWKNSYHYSMDIPSDDKW